MSETEYLFTFYTYTYRENVEENVLTIEHILNYY